MAQQVDEVWIVLDALAECTNRKEYPDRGLLTWMKILQDSQTSTHLLVASRPEQEIEASIKKWARDQDTISI